MILSLSRETTGSKKSINAWRNLLISGELPTPAPVLCVLFERLLTIVVFCTRVKRVWTPFAPSPSLLLAKRGRRAHHVVKSTLYGIWVFRNKATFFNVSYDRRATTKFIFGDLNRPKFELKVLEVPFF